MFRKVLPAHPENDRTDAQLDLMVSGGICITAQFAAVVLREQNIDVTGFDLVNEAYMSMFEKHGKAVPDEDPERLD